MGDIKSPENAFSHQPVREREGLDMETKERARVLRAIVIDYSTPFQFVRLRCNVIIHVGTYLK